MTIIAQHMNTLGLNGEVSPEAVRKAWNDMVKKHHPDVAGDASTQKIIEINNAYDALKNGVEYTIKGARSTSQSGSTSRSHATSEDSGDEKMSMNYTMPKTEIPASKRRMLSQTYAGIYGKLPTRGMIDRITGRRKYLPKLYVPSHIRVDENRIYFTIPGKDNIRKYDQIALFNLRETNKLFQLVDYTIFRVVMRKDYPSDASAIEVKCDDLVDGYKDVRVFLERE